MEEVPDATEEHVQNGSSAKFGYKCYCNTF